MYHTTNGIMVQIVYYIKDIKAHKIVDLFDRGLGISPEREYVPIYFDAMVPSVVFHHYILVLRYAFIPLTKG